jgi:hypothetical protein
MLLRAILILVAIAAGTGVACEGPQAERRVTPAYDEFTRRLTVLYADQDADGRVDQWSYFDGNRPLRGEKDSDGDGRIDRWEYFDAQGALERVGTSSQGDGIEDTWTWTATAGGDGRVDRSLSRDRRADRRDYYRDGQLVRAEEDTNGDGRLDRWSVYEGDVLRQVDFDTTFATGRPDHRVRYDGAGRFERVEVDPDGDGAFAVVPGAQPPTNLRGVKP